LAKKDRAEVVLNFLNFYKEKERKKVKKAYGSSVGVEYLDCGEERLR